MVDGAAVAVAEIFGSIAFLTATTMLPLALLGAFMALRRTAPEGRKKLAVSVMSGRAGEEQ